MFCWNSRFWSAVTKRVKPARTARWISSPFLRLDQPRSRTVRTNGRPSSSANSTGSDSSTRMRCVCEELTGHLESGNGLISGYRREGVKEVLDGVPRFEVVNESSDWNSGAHEHRGASEYLGVAVHYFVGSHRLSPTDETEFTSVALDVQPT